MPTIREPHDHREVAESFGVDAEGYDRNRPDYPAADLSRQRAKRRPILGGLINEYERAA